MDLLFKEDKYLLKAYYYSCPFIIKPLYSILGVTFARRILHVCWEAILDVLSTVLNGKSAAGVNNSLSLLLTGKEESRRAKESICSCLDGLQKAARLSCVLGAVTFHSLVIYISIFGNCLTCVKDENFCFVTDVCLNYTFANSFHF